MKTKVHVKRFDLNDEMYINIDSLKRSMIKFIEELSSSETLYFLHFDRLNYDVVDIWYEEILEEDEELDTELDISVDRYRGG